jgi:hypothetical protein
MVEYRFLITFVDGKKRLHVSVVDPSIWTLEAVAQSLIAENVQSIDILMPE